MQKENSVKDIYKHMQLSMIDGSINPLKTKRRLLYLTFILRTFNSVFVLNSRIFSATAL